MPTDADVAAVREALRIGDRSTIAWTDAKAALARIEARLAGADECEAISTALADDVRYLLTRLEAAEAVCRAASLYMRTDFALGEYTRATDQFTDAVTHWDANHRTPAAEVGHE